MERLGEKWEAKCFSYLGKTILLVQLGDESELPDLTDECDRFCKYAHRIIGADVTVGIGKVCGTILELSESAAGSPGGGVLSGDLWRHTGDQYYGDRSPGNE